MNQPCFSQQVLSWYALHGRKHLPWQQDITPYRVWVSEIMLQQTQVSTVIDYYLRFMQHFPTIFALAQAPEDEVLHLWTGLGYYARARNLHKCAKIVVQQYQGELPLELDPLSALPGIGRSTAAAIIAISADQPAAILDGNVKRVLCRYFAIPGWPGKKAIENLLWEKAEALLPEHSFRQYTQAMMDLGATLCTRSRPACQRCPLQAQCQAYQQDQPTAFPHSKPKQNKPERQTLLVMIQAPNGAYWLEKRPQQGIWGGLWSFPEVDTLEQASALTLQRFPGAQFELKALDTFRHTFSHYHLQITPVLIILTQAGLNCAETDKLQANWYNPLSPEKLGLAAPVKKLLTPKETL